MQHVTVRVPASTSNLGPGFDCLGVALRIYNDVTVTRSIKSRPHTVVGEAADLFFYHTRRAPFSFSVSITGSVPPSRGLGSSVTLRLGVLHALNALTGNLVEPLSIFQLCARLEGHPDNAAPAVFGGFTVVRGQTVQCFDVSGLLSFVLLIPDFEIKTSRASRIFPPRIARAAAVENFANEFAITDAFVSGNLR